MKRGIGMLMSRWRGNLFSHLCIFFWKQCKIFPSYSLIWTDVKSWHVCRIACTSKRCCPILSCERYRSHTSNGGYQAKSEENWHLREKFGPRAQLCSGEFSSARGGGCAARFVLFKLSCSQSHGQRGKVVEHERCFISNRSIVEHFVSAFPRDLGSFLSILRHILMHKNVSLTWPSPNRNPVLP